MPTEDALATLPLVELDAHAQAELARQARADSPDLIEAAIARIEILNPSLNALSSRGYEQARRFGTAGNHRSPFRGVPTLLKDLLDYPGQPSTYGSRLLAGYVPTAGSAYTQALDDAGLVILGKTSTSEFGLLGTTEPLANGPTRNPWDPALSAGGSSGGAVAAVASGMVPVAHASDGGGSIRGPASLCGVFGFKPSRGRTAANGMPQEMPTASLITEHCVSRTVRDSATWLRVTEASASPQHMPAADALAQRDAERLRIGLYRRDAFGEPPEREALNAAEAGASLCASLGHEVIDCDGPDFDAHASSQAFFDLTASALAGMIDPIALAMGDAFDASLLEPYTRDLIDRGRSSTTTELHRATQVLHTAGADAARIMTDYDVLLCPTTPFPAFPLGTGAPTADTPTLMAHTNRLAGYTVPASLAGWPAMSVPLYWTEEGLPLGCHFAAAVGQDERLFQLAFQLEAAQPWLPRLLAMNKKLECRSA